MTQLEATQREASPLDVSQLDQFAAVVHALAHIEIDANNETELTKFAALARLGSRQIESIIVKIASRTSTMHAQGRSGSAREILTEGGHVSTTTAKREAKRAETAKTLPQLGSALADGTVSGEHLDIVARTTRNLTAEQLTHLDTEALSTAATQTSPDDFAQLARNLTDRAKQDWGLGRAIEERQKSEFKMWRDRATGMGRFSGWVDPERYSFLQTQINAETASLAASRASDANTTKDEFLAIDALVSLVERGTGSIGRPTGIFHVDAETAINGPHTHSIRETDCGHRVPPETIQRFLCDSVIQPVVMSDGVALRVGRTHRTATAHQWTALRAMYDTCAWHGCTIQIGWCQAHHITFWERNGGTDIENLVPLCTHHHHRVHEGHWQLHLARDRTLTIKTPGGDTWRTTQPGRQRQVPAAPPKHRTRGGPP